MTTETGSENSGNPANGAEATAGTQTAATSGHWTDSIEDTELKGWAEAKGYNKADPVMVAKSYRELEKLYGADKAGRTVEIPSGDDKTQWDAFHQKLGRPESPDKYELALGEGADEEFTKWAKGTFHELGLTAKQAKALSEKWNEFSGSAATRSSEAYQAKIAGEEAALKKEWGTAYPNKIKSAQNAAREFILKSGVAKNQEEAVSLIDKMEETFGFGGLMKFFDHIGEKIGEDKFVSGDSSANGFGAMTPAAAKAKLAEKLADKDFQARYLNGEKEALGEVTRLHQMINAGR